MASPAYERRNARARALGYASYWDYRAHGNGQIPPSQPRLRGEALAQATGRRGRTALVDRIKPGDVVFAQPGGERDRKGRFHQIDITVLGTDGTETTYVLRGAALRDTDRLARQIDRKGGVFSPAYRDLLDNGVTDE